MTKEINHDGLSREQVVASRAKYGENVLTPPKKTSIWKLYIEKYNDPIIQILLVAAAVSFGLAFVNHDFMETIGIFLAIFLATTVGFYFELDAAKKFNVLTAMNDDQPVKVRREGKVTEIPRREVVVGDIIIVEPWRRGVSRCAPHRCHQPANRRVDTHWRDAYDKERRQ